MIAALKQTIAIYANDPEWARVRPPLVELTTARAKLLVAELKAIGFAMNGIRRDFRDKEITFRIYKAKGQ